MKKTRIKTPSVGVPTTIEQAERLLGEIGRTQRHVTKIEADMNDYLASVKAKFERMALPLNEQIEAKFQALHMFAEARRGELLKGKSKTVRLATGEILWRNTPPSVSVPKKPEKVAAIVQALKAAGLQDLVRTKEEINKEAVLDEPRRVDGIAGIKIRRVEEFVAKPFESQIERAEPVKKTERAA